MNNNRDISFRLSLVCAVATTCLIAAPATPAFAGVAPVSQLLGAITPLEAPTAVAVDQNEFIYVSESVNNHVLVLRPDGKLSKVVRGLAQPLPVALNSKGQLYVGNLERGNVEVFGPDLALLGKLGKGDGEFVKPVAIAVDGSDRIYVVDSKPAVIKVFNADGTFAFSFGGVGVGNGQFQSPTAIAINKTRGEVIVSDLVLSGWGDAARVQIFGLDGTFKSRFATRGATNNSFVRPIGLAIDSVGRIYVADAYQNVVGVYDEFGAYLGLTATDPTLRIPMGMAYAPFTSRLLVASLQGGRVDTYGIDTVANKLVADTATLAFGGVALGMRSAVQSLNLSNGGSAPLTLGQATLVGASAASFTIAADGCSRVSLAPGASCAIDLEFAPTAVGDVSALLAITANDAQTPEWRVALSGTGVYVPPFYLLTVQKTGSGRVIGGSIDCGLACTQSVVAGSTLGLTAVADPGWRFDHWAGSCTGVAVGCAVVVNQDAVVSAVFVQNPVVPQDDEDEEDDRKDDEERGRDHRGESHHDYPNDTKEQKRPKVADLRFEVGDIQLDHNWKRVWFSRDYIEPVVVAQTASRNDEEPVTVQVRNIDAEGFDIRLREWDYLDGTHGVETVGYVVMERGSHRFADGTRIEAGFIQSNRASGVKRFRFAQKFATAPVVVTGVTSYNKSKAVVGRLQNIDSTGFDFRLQEQEKNKRGGGLGKIAYIAWEPSLGTLDGMNFEVGRSANIMDHQLRGINFGQYLPTAPVFVAQMQTENDDDTATLRWAEKSTYSIQVRVDEEQSRDSETRHGGETVGYMVFSVAASESGKDSDGDGLSDFDESYTYGTRPLIADSDGDGIADGDEVNLWGSAWGGDADGDGLINLLDADADNDGYKDGVEQANGTDMADPTSYPKLEDLLERGSVTAGVAWQEIVFKKRFVDPVVVAKMVTSQNTTPVSVQIRRNGPSGFAVRLMAQNSGDPVVEEEIHYLSVERGQHQLAGGARVEAGHVRATVGPRFNHYQFSGAFNAVPVVVTSVLSTNSADAVSGWVRNVRTTGFDLWLRSAATDTTDSVAYIAWEPSSGLLGNMGFEVRNVPQVGTEAFSLTQFASPFATAPRLFAQLQSYSKGINRVLWGARDAVGVEWKLDAASQAEETMGFIAIE